MIHAKSVFKSIQQGLLICNSEGRIVYFNDAYGAFIGKSLEEVVGVPIKKLRQGSIVPQVIKDKRKREHIYRKEGNREYYANVYPIMEGDKLTGTISIVTTLDREKLQKEQKGTLQEQVRRYEKKVIEDMMFLYGYDTEGKKKVAKELNISLATLYNKLQF